MTMKKDRVIARYILNAQISSDGGKSIYEISNLSRHAFNEAYDGKDRYILGAIKMIRSSKDSNFRFFVKPNSWTAFIVYFETRIHGEKFQVSFHSYDESLRPYCLGKAHHGFRTRWDHGSSRDTAVAIAEYYGIL